MFKLSRDPDTDALQTPFVQETNRRAAQLAKVRGMLPTECLVDAQHQIEAEQPDLVEQHKNLMDAYNMGGLYFAALTSQEQAALETFTALERLAERRESQIERFAVPADPFEAEIERTLKADFGGDIHRYEDAMHFVAEQHPDLARAYAMRTHAE